MGIVQKIRERAYQLYESRGKEDGHADEDRLRAEAEFSSAIYFASESGPLRQGEIVTDLMQLVPTARSTKANPEGDIQVHPFAVIVSQDCDLDQDFQARIKLQANTTTAADKLLASVLLCQAADATQLLSTIMGKDVKKRIYQNKDERYQYLREIRPEQDATGRGVPSLILDFKRFFTLSPTDI